MKLFRFIAALMLFSSPLFVVAQLPEWAPPLDSVQNSSALFQYMPGKGAVEMSIPDRRSDSLQQQFQPGFFPDEVDSFVRPSGMENFSTPVLASSIVNICDYPASTVVKLVIRYNNGATSSCSGAMIGPNLVLTAGHCVFDHANGLGWPSSIEVIPSYENGIGCSGSYMASSFYAFNGWLLNNDFNWDIGWLQLSSNIGYNIGWLGFGYNSNDAFFTNCGNEFHTLGYPGPSLSNGEYMYHMQGCWDYPLGTHLLYANHQGYGGQSGSCTYWKENQSNRYVFAVLSHGTSQPPINTGYCRIDQQKFEVLQTFSTQVSTQPSELRNPEAVLIYPNPWIDKINIKFPAQVKWLESTLIDHYGRIIASWKRMSHTDKLCTLSLPSDKQDLSPGVYFLQINTDCGKYFQKVFKQ